MRQLALLHFRNTIVLSVKLEDALSRPRARIPPSVTQMLLILQVGTVRLSLILSLSLTYLISFSLSLSLSFSVFICFPFISLSRFVSLYLSHTHTLALTCLLSLCRVSMSRGV